MAKPEKTRENGISAAVTMLAEAFGRTVTVVTFRAYIAGLEGLTVEQIEQGVNRALKTCKFMPAPSELRELAGDLKGQDRAVKAWMALELAIVRQGAYRTVDFDDPVINATVRSLGGWERVCTTDAKEFDTFTRQKFIAAYTSLYAAGVGEEEAAPLQGIFDRENARLGYPPQEPQKIVTGLPVPQRSPRIGNSASVPNISEGGK
jgi:hypothetical protein